MHLGQRLDEWLRATLLAPSRGVRGWLSRVGLFLLFWYRDATQKGVNVRAMALAYQLLFSLVPAAAVAASIYAGLPALAGTREQFLTAVIGTIVPVDEATILLNIQRFTNNAGTVGTIGGGVLLFFTVSLARTVDNAFNELWGVQRRRSIMQSWSGMALLLVVGTAMVALWLQTLGPWLARRMAGSASAGLLLDWTVAVLVFYIFYTAIPHTRVRAVPALVGALVAASGWMGARLGFAIYVVRLVSYDKLYGSLGVLPLFLLWLYVSWLVALLGCLAARVVQDFRHLKDSEHHRITGERGRVFWALVLLRPILRAHTAGEGPALPVHEMATRLAQPGAFFEDLAERLVRHGVLVPWEGRPGTYSLAHDPQVIPLSRVLGAVERDPFQVPESASTQDEALAHDLEEMGAFLEQARKDSAGAFAQRSLSWLQGEDSS